MHILYIHQHFTTNAGASGTRSYDYARYLVQRGHRVTVITGVYALGSFVQTGGPLVQTRFIDGVRIVIINIPYANQMSFPGRVSSFLLFAMMSVWTALRQGRVDVVLATSTPLTVGLPALAMKWLRGVPYVFEVRDIWPEFAVSIGVLKNPILIKLASWAEAIFYRFAAKVQTISDGMKHILARRLDEKKLAVVPTGMDMGLYENVQPDSSVRDELGWSNRVIAVYAGAHSDANGLEYVIEAATALKDDLRIGLLLIGEGRRKDDLVQMVSDRGLTNITFRPRTVKQKLIGILADCEVGMVILKPLPEFAVAMPNKLFDYLAAGCAVVVNFEGDASEQLSSTNSGIAVDADDPTSLANVLSQWADRRDTLRQARQAAGKLAKSYDRKLWAAKLEKVLIEAAG